jgi:hypothetical protein
MEWFCKGTAKRFLPLESDQRVNFSKKNNFAIKVRTVWDGAG